MDIQPEPVLSETDERELGCTIALEYTDRVTFAAQQWGTPLVDAVVVTNTSVGLIEDLEVVLRLASGEAEPWTGRLAGLGAGMTARLEPRGLGLSASRLAQRTEGERTTIEAEARSGGGIKRGSFELDVLAYDQWPGGWCVPEVTAAFVTPNHSLVAQLLQGARRVLAERGERDAIDGYQSGSRQRAALIAEACFASLVGQGIGYIQPPASFEREGQRVRLIDRVMREKFGTCLDLSLALLAMWEQAGLSGVLLLPEGHAMPAFWTHPASLAEAVIDEPARIRNLIELGEIVAVESTHVTQAGAQFARAVESARGSMQRPGSAFVAIDIKACRKRGVRPLPLREGELAGLDPAQMNTNAATEALGGAAIGSVSLAERAESAKAAGAPEIRETGSARIARWQSRLLDLSLRNRLINFRETGRSVTLSVPDVSKLEDLLSGGERVRILWKKEMDAALTGEELASGRVYASLTESETQSRLLTMYRTAQSSIEETGANLLHLAIGTLVWYETPTSDVARRAPILMLPARLVRSATGSGYAYNLELSDEPARVNITLLEKMQTQFGIEIRGLSELPEDENGIDVPLVLRNFREAIRDSARWEVEESAHLGLFSFNKFLMWRDLKENLSALRENRLVDHLVERPGEEFDARPFPSADALDDERRPGTPLCTRDADSSQIVAVCAASEGRSFVLEGPPGTGKSQTIANMIADALASGKRVLFVAEKLAALSVVRHRLEQDGLGAFCLELHSAKASKKEVLEQLRAALEAEKPGASAEWEQLCTELGVTREKLNAYVREMHAARASGETLYRALGSLAELGPQQVVSLPAEELAQVTAERLAAWRGAVKGLFEASGPVNPAGQHALAGVGVSEWAFDLPERASSALARASEALDALDTSLGAWLAQAAEGASGEMLSCESVRALVELAPVLAESPGAPAGLIEGEGSRRSHERLAGAIELGRKHEALVRELGQRYQPELLEIEHLGWLDRAKRARDQISLVRFFRARGVRKELRAYAKGELPALAGVISDLERALEAKRLARELDAMGDVAAALGGLWAGAQSDWERLGRVHAWCERFASMLASVQEMEMRAGLVRTAGDAMRCAGTSGAVESLDRAWKAWSEAFVEAERVLQLRTQDALPSEVPGWHTAAGEAIDRWLGGLGELREWCAYSAARKSAIEVGLADVVSNYEDGRLGRGEIVGAFEASYARAWFTAVGNSSEAVRSFGAESHEKLIERFRELDKGSLLLAREVVASKLADRTPSAGARASAQSEVGLLRRELEKKRRHLPTRQLIERMPNLLPRLKPCFLMSPLSVAQFLDPSMPRFDVVIFDEASQIPVWDAIGAIARGTEVIVVGDSKQLPPTSFFRSIEGEEDATDEENAVDDMESILKECNASRVPALRLKWHYRSRHESLIAFSNHHYYQNELMTFPSPEDRSERMGVTLRRVADGVYDRGGTRTNLIEAERVAAEVVRLLLDENDQDSIGIVTFNQAQQTLIQDLLDAARRDHPEIERHFTAEVEEPVFVKNLENVQGDERDTIIFSVGYGLDKEGRPSMNFGPLNKEGGERRLNVAVTRAKRRLVVFSSMTNEMIDLRRTRVTGVAHFKKFLEYAERGPAALAEYARERETPESRDRFKNALAEELRRRGYAVDTDVGCATYRVDIGIRDEKNPGKYLLGIECDGNHYRSASTARDRDRTRPSVLKGLGWRLHRVWSVHWRISPDKCLAAIDAAVVRARDEAGGHAPVADSNPSAPVIARAPAVDAKPSKNEDRAEVYRPASRGRWRLGQRDVYAPETDELLARWLGMIVVAEAPVTTELTLRRLAAFCELTSVREKFRTRFAEVLSILEHSGRVKRRGDTLWRTADDPEGETQVRAAGAEPESRRDAELIPPEEWEAAVLLVVREQFGMPREELVKETSVRLGFTRATQASAASVEAAIDRLTVSGRLLERGGAIGPGS